MATGPYLDENLQYADLISNLISPPDARGPNQAQQDMRNNLSPNATELRFPQAPTTTTSQPAMPGPKPVPTLASTVFRQALGDNSPGATDTGTSPAATSSTGNDQPNGNNWRPANQAGEAKLEQDQAELRRLQTTGPGVNKIKNPFLRGVAKVADVVGSTLTPGAAAQIPGTTLHNRMLQGQAQQRVATDQASQQSAASIADTQSQTQERMAQAARQNAQAESYAPVTLAPEQAAAIGHPELAGEQISQRAYAQMISAKGHTDAATTGANARTESAKTGADARVQSATIGADARTTSAQTAADSRTQSAQISADARKFAAAHRATAGRTPNDALRQPMIDAATAQVNRLNDYYYDADANDGRGGFYDPANKDKAYTPEEFTDMKNQIATKLDKDLASKRLSPLGVRFTVNDTTPGKDGAQVASAKPAQSTAPAQTTQATPPAGATHQYRDKSGNVVGYAVNGKYVPAAAAAAPAQTVSGGSGKPIIQDGAGKPLTNPDIAKEYLEKAGGDKEKARQLANHDKWRF